jgi:hypothetical protein
VLGKTVNLLRAKHALNATLVSAFHAFSSSTLKRSHNTPMEAQGGRMHSSYSFMALALDEGEWSVSHPGHASPRGKDPRYPLDRRLGGTQSRSGHRR